jgi:MFS family permease
MPTSKHILPIIIFAQFCCTSLWFASNGILNELIVGFNLDSSALGHLTSAVQFGFIIGTLTFAVLSIADRFPPSKVFFISAILGSLFNLGITYEGNTITSLLFFRFMTGFFLAGIYPVGMKIATDYYEKGLGKSLGFLVGALVLGTAFPHLLNGIGNNLQWEYVIYITSVISIIGGLSIMLFVPIGPFRKKSLGLDLTACFKVFKNKEFRISALGYFGHMWELYAFWAFVPFIILSYNQMNPNETLDISNYSFIIIGIGSISCVVGAYVSSVIGITKTAYSTLLISGICCLLLPFIFQYNSSILFISFMLIWGSTVIADSPLFSAMVAQNAPAEIKGTALTIVNCIGFAISILSIQFLNSLILSTDSNLIYSILAIGPILGLLAKKKVSK